MPVPPGRNGGAHRRPTSRRRALIRRAGLAVGVLGCAVTATAMIAYGSQSTPPPPAPLPSATFSVAPQSLPTITAAVPPVGRTAPAGPQATAAPPPRCDTTLTPETVVIPALCIHAPLVPTAQQSSGALVIPADVHRVGWWDGGATLTATTGSTLLAGHVDYVGQGEGAFYQLYRSRPGTVVYTADGAGRVSRWQVTRLLVVQKAKLPDWVFAGRAGARQLVMVTCGGPVDEVPGYGGTYEDNVIAVAVPA